MGIDWTNVKDPWTNVAKLILRSSRALERGQHYQVGMDAVMMGNSRIENGHMTARPWMCPALAMLSNMDDVIASPLTKCGSTWDNLKLSRRLSCKATER